MYAPVPPVGATDNDVVPEIGSIQFVNPVGFNVPVNGVATVSVIVNSGL